MTRLLLVFMGSGLGGMCRYAVGLGLRRWGDQGYPIATLLVNVVGCFVAGLVWPAFSNATPPSPLSLERARLLLLVGGLGGFTTFSAFGLESIGMARNEGWPHAMLNIALNVGLGLAAVMLGIKLAEARST